MSEEVLQPHPGVDITSVRPKQPETEARNKLRSLTLPSLRWLSELRTVSNSNPMTSTAGMLMLSIIVIGVIDHYMPVNPADTSARMPIGVISTAEVSTLAPTFTPTPGLTPEPTPTTSVARRMYEARLRYGRPASESFPDEQAPATPTASQYKKDVEGRIRKASILEDIDITLLDKKMDAIIDEKTVVYALPSKASGKTGLELDPNSSYRIRSESAPYSLVIQKKNPRRETEYWYVLLPDQTKDQKVVIKKNGSNEEFVVEGGVAFIIDTAPEGKSKPDKTFARLVQGR